MVRLVRIRGNESGAETVQLAFAMPMLFLLAMSVIQLCLMGFAVLTLTSEAEQAAWSVSIDELRSCAGESNASQLIKQEIEAAGIGLDSSKLIVSNAAFTSVAEFTPKPKTTQILNNNVVASEAEHSRYQLGELYRETTEGLVEFDVTYELPTIINLPGLGHMSVTKHVARERIASTRTEIR